MLIFTRNHEMALFIYTKRYTLRLAWCWLLTSIGAWYGQRVAEVCPQWLLSSYFAPRYQVDVFGIYDPMVTRWCLFICIIWLSSIQIRVL